MCPGFFSRYGTVHRTTASPPSSPTRSSGRQCILAFCSLAPSEFRFLSVAIQPPPPAACLPRPASRGYHEVAYGVGGWGGAPSANTPCVTIRRKKDHHPPYIFSTLVLPPIFIVTQPRPSHANCTRRSGKPRRGGCSGPPPSALIAPRFRWRPLATADTTEVTHTTPLCAAPPGRDALMSASKAVPATQERMHRQ